MYLCLECMFIVGVVSGRFAYTEEGLLYEKE